MHIHKLRTLGSINLINHYTDDKNRTEGASKIAQYVRAFTEFYSQIPHSGRREQQVIL